MPVELSRLVAIPFLEEFAEALLLGQKTATTRTKRYGKAGDKFSAFGGRFELLGVEAKLLKDVANNLYGEEGFDNPGAFIELWAELHPRTGYNPQQKVFLHRFERIE